MMIMGLGIRGWSEYWPTDWWASPHRSCCSLRLMRTASSSTLWSSWTSFSMIVIIWSWPSRLSHRRQRWWCLSTAPVSVKGRNTDFRLNFFSPRLRWEEGVGEIQSKITKRQTKVLFTIFLVPRFGFIFKLLKFSSIILDQKKMWWK